MNRLLLASPVLIKKGSFVYLTQISGKVAIDTSGNASYSEMVLNNGAYYKLNDLSNWRMLINAITTFNSYKNNFQLAYSYATLGFYEITLTFTSSNLTFSYFVEITQCKF